MKPYVSIDIETTGLDPERCQILEIGAIIDDWVSPVESLPMFHCYVDHGLYHGEPYALGLNVKILNILANRENLKDHEVFYFPGQVAAYFNGFLAHYGVDPKRVPAAGKNFASFDRQFLERLPKFKDLVRFNHRVLDPAMLFVDFENDDGLPDTKTCMKRAGIGGEVAHTALEDARVVIELIRIGRQVRELA